MPSPTPRKQDRRPQLARHAERHAPFGGAIELAQDQSVDGNRASELARLGQGVLPGGGIEDQPRPALPVRGLALDHAADLGEFGHQVVLGVQPARGVDQQTRDAARLGRSERVVDRPPPDRRRCPGEPPRCPAARPTAPAARWRRRGRCRRRRASRVWPASCSSRASFAIVVVLPTPLTPTTRMTAGRSSSGTGGRRLLQQVADLDRQILAQPRQSPRPHRGAPVDATARPASSMSRLRDRRRSAPPRVPRPPRRRAPPDPRPRRPRDRGSRCGT